MKLSINRQVRLKSRPSDVPGPENFEIVETSVPELEERQVLVRNSYLSVEPAMHRWVSAAGMYYEPVPLGSVMRSFAAGRVEASRHPDFRPGEYVTGMFGWQDYAVVEAEGIERKITDTDLPISTALGVLGINGLTAYFGLLDVGQLKSGETVVVSAAGGAVGSCVGQIAKIKGCHTVGIAGGDRKARLCRDEFGYDEVLDYKAGDVDRALEATCPAGVDVYFDNTSGKISDAVLRHLRVGARVAICGRISILSWDPTPQGPRVEGHLLGKRARMQGFIIFDYAARYQEALRELSQWVRAGLLRYREHILEGIEKAPGSIAMLYRGANLGKLLIRLV